MYNNMLDVAGRIGYLEGAMSGGNNIYWRGSMSGLSAPDRRPLRRPAVEGLAPHPHDQEPRGRPGRPAPMKKDLNGVRVGVDGNGDGRRGADIGAHEAKAKAHRGGKGGKNHQGGKGGNDGKSGNQTAHHGGKSHPAQWHGGKNRLAYRT